MSINESIDDTEKELFHALLDDYLEKYFDDDEKYKNNKSNNIIKNNLSSDELCIMVYDKINNNCNDNSKRNNFEEMSNNICKPINIDNNNDVQENLLLFTSDLIINNNNDNNNNDNNNNNNDNNGDINNNNNNQSGTEKKTKYKRISTQDNIKDLDPSMFNIEDEDYHNFRKRKKIKNNYNHENNTKLSKEIEELLTFPKLLSDCFNSADFDTLKSAINQFIDPKCKLITTSLLQPVIGQDLFLTFFESLLQNYPNALLICKGSTMLDSKVFGARVYFSGTETFTSNNSYLHSNSSKPQNLNFLQFVQDKDFDVDNLDLSVNLFMKGTILFKCKNTRTGIKINNCVIKWKPAVIE